jgi:hypothetical protein
MNTLAAYLFVISLFLPLVALVVGIGFAIVPRAGSQGARAHPTMTTNPAGR